MRKLKKAFSLTLALVMCLGLTVPAFATTIDVTYSVDPIGVATIQGADYNFEDVYVFDQDVLVAPRDGRSFKFLFMCDVNETLGGSYGGNLSGYGGGIAQVKKDDVCLFRFSVDSVNGRDSAPYMGTKTYIDQLIAEGVPVDFQPYSPTQPEQPAEPATASPTNDKLEVNGNAADPTVYKINGSNYFKIRDVAALLNGTEKQFAVGYDGSKNAVTATTGQGYTKQPGDLAGAPASGSQSAEPSNDAIYVNGEKITAEVYKIGGSNYFKLRDLGKALNFYVGWSADRGMYIETDKPYSE